MEWLEYCNKDRNDLNDEADIQHAFNAMGEKKLGVYYLDGYKEIHDEDGTRKIGYEYMGCRFHRCPHKCGVESVQSDEDFLRETKRLEFLEENLDVFHIIRGCEWAEEKKKIFKQRRFIKSNISPFLGWKHVGEQEILKAVENGSFYGIMCVDIETPDEVVAKYEKLNFPFIFNKVGIDEDMLSPEVLEEARKRNTSFPVSVKTLTWNAKSFIAVSPLLKFYMKLGMKISNVQWALQYQVGKPFKYFVESLVEERIAAESSTPKNTSRGDRAKLALNSAVGKFKTTPKLSEVFLLSCASYSETIFITCVFFPTIITARLRQFS